MKSIAYLTAVALSVIGLGFAGNDDFEQAKAEERQYCKRVSSGIHRDFKGICDGRADNEN